MKNKKLIVLIIIVLVLVLSVIVITKNNKTDNKLIDVASTVQYDNENGVYYIKNEITGDVIANSTDEGGLQIYIDNPNYNPNPLKTYSNMSQ